MATVVIPWTNGTGNITLVYNGQGDGTIVVTSDVNNLRVERSQSVKVKAINSNLEVQVTIRQASNMIQGEVYSDEALACDVVFASKTDGTLHIIRGESNWPSPNNYTPIGIVVIPGNHGTVGTDTCGVMSLSRMSYLTPETGTDSSGTEGGSALMIGSGYIIEDMFCYERVVMTSDETPNTAVGLAPRDSAGRPAISSPTQQTVGGGVVRSGSGSFAPTPYAGSDMQSGGFNASYSTKAFDTAHGHNFLADFDGIKNTKIMTDLATGEDWRNLSTLTQSTTDPGYYPMACCCARFHTLGTKAFKDCSISELQEGTGFWYFPAIGETNYLFARKADIYDTVSRLITAYGTGNPSTGNIMTSTRSLYANQPTVMSWLQQPGTVITSSNVGIIYTRTTEAFMRLKKTSDMKQSAPIWWSNLYYSSDNNVESDIVFSNPNGLSVTFSSSDTNVATIDASGNVTFVGNGFCKLSATFAGNSTYAPKTVTCTLRLHIDYSTDYLTFTALETGTFTLTIPASITATHVPSVSYSLDYGETWTTVANSSSEVVITTPTVYIGGKVLWKAVSQRFATSSTNYCNFSATCNFEASGNIMSLHYGDDFIGKTALKTYTYTMSGLFRANSKLINAENLVLPATTLRTRCYQYLFYQANKLVKAPRLLPATTLNSYCYNSMFRGCTSLTTMPELPATTLADYCYNGMFQDCVKLTTAPELPAATLTSHCYCQMFYGCSRLNSITCLATDISASNCTSNWVYNVAASGTFTKASSMTSWTTGNNGIPSGWTVVNKT